MLTQVLSGLLATWAAHKFKSSNGYHHSNLGIVSEILDNQTTETEHV